MNNPECFEAPFCWVKMLQVGQQEMQIGCLFLDSREAAELWNRQISCNMIETVLFIYLFFRKGR